MKHKIAALWFALMLLTACAAQESNLAEAQNAPPPAEAAAPETEAAQTEEEPMDHVMLKIEIGDAVLTAEFADTEAAEVLKAKLEEGDVTITVSNYGGWEKVGELPWSLPANDIQIDAVPGDIMLYCGNSIVLFYGNNSWAYTRLGTIATNSAESLRAALGGEDAELRLSLSYETGTKIKQQGEE